MNPHPQSYCLMCQLLVYQLGKALFQGCWNRTREECHQYNKAYTHARVVIADTGSVGQTTPRGDVCTARRNGHIVGMPDGSRSKTSTLLSMY